MSTPFLVGAELWMNAADRHLRVGLLSHQAALLSTGETTAQGFHRVFQDHLVALFGPEHGYFGRAAAGEATETERHPTWGIPVYSLYGEHRKPTPEMLSGLDVLVIDLQDLGVRCYTYLATLRLALEACEEANVRCVVCERPIPWAHSSFGPIAREEDFSFVAPCAVPLVHGMNQLEAADASPYRHERAPMSARQEGLDRPVGAPNFIPPSPAICSWETAWTYPATVFAEAFPALDVGRGTPLAFRTLRAPWLKGEALAEALNARGLAGVRFYDDSQSSTLGGIRLYVTESERFDPWAASCALLAELLRAHRAEMMVGARPAWLGKLLGNAELASSLINEI